MAVSEKDREMLEKERDKIEMLCKEILALLKDPNNNTTIKQSVIGIQSSISRIASYSNSKNTNLNDLNNMADNILHFLSNKFPEVVERALQKQLMSPETIKKFAKKGLPLPSLTSEYSASWSMVICLLDRYCCYVASIQYDLANKKGNFITLPKNITLLKNLNLGNITNT